MKTWQVIVVLMLLAASGWAILLFPPGERTLRQDAVLPLPTPEPEPAKGRVTLGFVGDIMLSRSVGDTMLAKGDWTWPFMAVASVTRDADIMFANLETTISTGGERGGCGYCFRADPRVTEGLQYAGFDVLSLANNHMWDYGLSALEDTLKYLAAGDISVAGAGRTLTEARGPVVRTVAGTRIAYVAFTDMLPLSAQATENRAGVNLYDATRMAEDIGRARELADIVVVSFHTGIEYESLHSVSQQTLYRSAIDAGADLVIGHHPHVVQDAERYGRGWIFYSLGNFVFDQNWSDATRRGMMVSVTVDGGFIRSVATSSVDISKQYQPSVRK